MRIRTTSTQRTYRYVRLAIIGATVFLATGVALEVASGTALPSVSATYYGPAGPVFVGALSAIALALLALSGIYVAYGDTAWVEALFLGVAPAVIAIVVSALWRLGSKALHHPVLVGLAVAAFAALTVFGVPFPAVVGAAALAGWLLARGGLIGAIGIGSVMLILLAAFCINFAVWAWLKYR